MVDHVHHILGEVHVARFQVLFLQSSFQAFDYSFVESGSRSGLIPLYSQDLDHLIHTLNSNFLHAKPALCIYFCTSVKSLWNRKIISRRFFLEILLSNSSWSEEYVSQWHHPPCSLTISFCYLIPLALTEGIFSLSSLLTDSSPLRLSFQAP